MLREERCMQKVATQNMYRYNSHDIDIDDNGEDLYNFPQEKKKKKKKIDTDVSIAKLKVIHRVTRNRNFGLVLVERVVTVSSLKYGTVKPDYIEPSYIKLSLILNNFCAP